MLEKEIDNIFNNNKNNFLNYIKNINNKEDFKLFLNNLKYNIINEFDNYAKNQNISTINMLLYNYQNYPLMTTFYVNGLYNIEDYNWNDYEIKKDFVILLFIKFIINNNLKYLF